MRKLMILFSIFMIFSIACSKNPTLPPPPPQPPPPPKPIVNYMFPSEEVPVNSRIVKPGLPVPVVADWQNAGVVDHTTTVPISNTNLDFSNDFRTFVPWQAGLKLVATVQGENFEFDLPFVKDPQRLEQLARDFRYYHMRSLPMARRTIYVNNQTRWNVDWVISWWNQVGVVNLIAGNGKPKIQIHDGEGDFMYYRSEWLCKISKNPTSTNSPIGEMIILHELGHCLGYYHSPYWDSIMCVGEDMTTCAPRPSRVLVPLEVRALQLLYQNVPY